VKKFKKYKEVVQFKKILSLGVQKEKKVGNRCSNPSNLSALTSGHFLTGDSLTTVSEQNLTATPITRLNR